MNLILFESFTKLSLVRAVFWFVMGICLLIMPELDFLLNGIFYMLIGYFLINSVLRIIFLANEKVVGNNKNNRVKLVCRYINWGIAILFFITTIHFIIFREYLNEFTPVFLDGLLTLEGIYYFMIAIFAVTARQKLLLIILSVSVFLGAIVSIGFTFGFGIGGVAGIITTLGIALMLATLYEMASFGIAYRNRTNRLIGRA